MQCNAVIGSAVQSDYLATTRSVVGVRQGANPRLLGGSEEGTSNGRDSGGGGGEGEQQRQSMVF